jgi:hypothetical protein
MNIQQILVDHSQKENGPFPIATSKSSRADREREREGESYEILIVVSFQ